MQKNIMPKLIRRREVERRLGISRSTIYDRLDTCSPRHDPSFPMPVKLGGASRSIGWLEHEVDDYIAAIVQTSRDGQALPKITNKLEELLGEYDAAAQRALNAVREHVSGIIASEREACACIAEGFSTEASAAIRKRGNYE